MDTKDFFSKSKFWLVNRNIPLFRMVQRKKGRKIMKVVAVIVVVEYLN
jgi:hypothetical protein